jgi:multiple sugar transport system substrate-binding protein
MIDLCAKKREGIMNTKRKTFRVAIRKFDPFASAIQKQWADFQAAEGGGMELEGVSLDLHPLYDSLFEQGGLKNGEWDVAFLPSDWFAQAYEEQAVLDLSQDLKSDPPEGFPGAWTDNLLRLQQFDNTVLGLPYHDGPECLIYRKDLFDSPREQAAYESLYGTPLGIPRNWHEYHQIARFFQRPDEGLFGTVFAAFPDGHNTVYDFCLQLWTRGGELFDSAGKIQFNTPEAVRALEFYRAILNDTSAVHPGSREFDSVKSGLTFAGGEIAMMVNWFGFASLAQTFDASKAKGHVDIAPIPGDPGGSPVSLSVYWILSVAAGSQHPEIAYRFLRHCASARMDKLLTLEGGIGCRKSTWEDPDVNAVIPFYQKMSSLHQVARELPKRSDWNALAARIDRLVLDAINTDRPISELVKQHQG